MLGQRDAFLTVYILQTGGLARENKLMFSRSSELLIAREAFRICSPCCQHGARRGSGEK